MPRHKPRLTLRIIGYTAVALLFAAGAILWFVDQRATSQAEDNAAARAHFIADVLLRDRLTEDDFQRPVTGQRRAKLNALFARAMRSEGVERINLVGPSGEITFSTETDLIGGSPQQGEAHVASSLHGREVRSVGSTTIGERPVKVLETYLPVQPSGQTGRPIGVFELYQDYESRVAAQARATTVPVAGFLLLALLVLCATLVPILRRVTAAVEVRNQRLVTQAAKLERSLALAHEARTEAEAARRALSDQNKRLRELDRLKDEFVATASHELRTPLTSISGYLEMSLDPAEGGLSPATESHLRIVQRNADRLSVLVEQLLFLARADSHPLEIERQQVDLGEMLTEAAETFLMLHLLHVEVSLTAVVAYDALNSFVRSAVFFLPAGLGAAWPWLLALLALCWATPRHHGLGLATERAAWASAAALWAVLLLPVLRGAAGREAGLTLHFLDVGQGDAAVILTPGGHAVVVDAGPRNDRFDAGRGWGLMWIVAAVP